MQRLARVAGLVGEPAIRGPSLGRRRIGGDDVDGLVRRHDLAHVVSFDAAHEPIDIAMVLCVHSYSAAIWQGDEDVAGVQMRPKLKGEAECLDLAGNLELEDARLGNKAHYAAAQAVRVRRDIGQGLVLFGVDVRGAAGVEAHGSQAMQGHGPPADGANFKAEGRPLVGSIDKLLDSCSVDVRHFPLVEPIDLERDEVRVGRRGAFLPAERGVQDEEFAAEHIRRLPGASEHGIHAVLMEVIGAAVAVEPEEFQAVLGDVEKVPAHFGEGAELEALQVAEFLASGRGPLLDPR